MTAENTIDTKKMNIHFEATVYIILQFNIHKEQRITQTLKRNRRNAGQLV